MKVDTGEKENPDVVIARLQASLESAQAIALANQKEAEKHQTAFVKQNEEVIKLRRINETYLEIIRNLARGSIR